MIGVGWLLVQSFTEIGPLAWSRVLYRELGWAVALPGSVPRDKVRKKPSTSDAFQIILPLEMPTPSSIISAKLGVVDGMRTTIDFNVPDAVLKYLQQNASSGVSLI